MTWWKLGWYTTLKALQDNFFTEKYLILTKKVNVPKALFQRRVPKGTTSRLLRSYFGNFFCLSAPTASSVSQNFTIFLFRLFRIQLGTGWGPVGVKLGSSWGPVGVQFGLSKNHWFLPGRSSYSKNLKTPFFGGIFQIPVVG